MPPRLPPGPPHADTVTHRPDCTADVPGWPPRRGEGPKTRQGTAQRGPLHGRHSPVPGEPVTARALAEPTCRPRLSSRTHEYLPFLTPQPPRRPLPQQRTPGQLSGGGGQHWCPGAKGFAWVPPAGSIQSRQADRSMPEPAAWPEPGLLWPEPWEGALRGAASRAPGLLCDATCPVSATPPCPRSRAAWGAQPQRLTVRLRPLTSTGL